MLRGGTLAFLDGMIDINEVVSWDTKLRAVFM